jgi:hypothetical protein
MASSQTLKGNENSKKTKQRRGIKKGRGEMQEYERKDKKENMIYPNLTSQRMKLSHPFL